MKSPLIRQAQRVFNTPLLITKGKLDAILAAVGPRLGMDIEDVPASAMDEIALQNRANYPGASWNDNGNYAVTRQGTGIIPIHGTLVRRGSSMDAMSGMRSYESIREDLQAAVADVNVKRILLDVDSYGGEVDDCFDLATLIYATRQVKRIDAFANSYAFSAGYALASAAQTVSVTQTGGVGSIGVICEHCDQSGFDEKLGVKYTTIFAGSHKNDYSAHAPLSKEVIAQAQREIDRTYDIFVAQVARNRGMSEGAVRATQAGLFYGAEGVAAGLAERVGNFDEILGAMEQMNLGQRQRLTASAADAPEADASAAEGEEMPTPAALESAVGGRAAEEKDPISAAPPEELSAAKAAGETKPEEPDEDDDEEEIKPMAVEETKPSAADPGMNLNQNAAAQIARMCSLAGKSEMIADFLDRKVTLDTAMQELHSARVAEQPQLNPQQHRSPASNGLAELENQAKVHAMQNGGTRQKAFSQAIRQNPQVYAEYLRQNPQLDGGKTADQFAQ